MQKLRNETARCLEGVSFSYCLIMAYIHCRIRTQIQTRIRTPNPMATSHYQGSHFCGLKKFHNISMIFPVFLKLISRYFVIIFKVIILEKQSEIVHVGPPNLELRGEFLLPIQFFQVSYHFSMIFINFSKFHDNSRFSRYTLIFPGFPGREGILDYAEVITLHGVRPHINPNCQLQEWDRNPRPSPEM